MSPLKWLVGAVTPLAFYLTVLATASAYGDDKDWWQISQLAAFDAAVICLMAALTLWERQRGRAYLAKVLADAANTQQRAVRAVGASMARLEDTQAEILAELLARRTGDAAPRRPRRPRPRNGRPSGPGHPDDVEIAFELGRIVAEDRRKRDGGDNGSEPKNGSPD